LTAVARPLGARLPASARTFWRESPIGYGLSTLVTFHYFALTNVLFFTGIEGSTRYLGPLLGLG
jgi:hypothetical protein